MLNKPHVTDTRLQARGARQKAGLGRLFLVTASSVNPENKDRKTGNAVFASKAIEIIRPKQINPVISDTNAVK